MNRKITRIKPSTRKPATSSQPAFALLLLAGTLLLLALAFLPQPALAATPITTCTELQNIRSNLGGDYYLANDIDCSGFGNFKPIGTYANEFTGTFDGKGYKITHLYINRASTDYVGLFGYTGSRSEIKNVGLEEVDVSGYCIVGGLVGYNSGTITNSYSSGSVTGSTAVGGLVGLNSGTITNSYSSGSVTGSEAVGGLVGYNYKGTITNSYSSGSVTGSTAVGGLVGYNSGTITNSYWDIFRSGRSNCVGYGSSSGCTGKNRGNSKPHYWYYSTHAPMDQWDFDNIWGIVEGVTYPYLRWQYADNNCTCGDICVNETGWWRDKGKFIASNRPIQHAINNAIAGETICVMDGTYNENVVVTKSHLTIRSANGPAVTTVSASRNPGNHVFSITDQTDVTLKGFEIRDAHGTSESVAGIYMYNASECNISGNIMTNISATGFFEYACGIWLKDSSDNSFDTNTVYNLSSADSRACGIYLSRSSDNSFHTSTVYNLDAYYVTDGILLKDSSDNSFDTSTVYNLSSANGDAYGIDLYSSSGNSFVTTTLYNLSANDNAYGIELYSSSGNSFDTSTVYNLSANAGVYNGYAYGIWLKDSSDNSFDTSTVYNLDACYANGIYLFSSSGNSFDTSTVYNLDAYSACGIPLYYSSRNSFDTTTVYNLSAYFDANGIMLWPSSGNSFDTTTVYNLSADKYAYGIMLLQTSSDNSFSSGSISDINAPTWWDFCSRENAHGNSAEDIRISSIATTISFTYDNGIMLKSVQTPPADPADKLNIWKYVTVTELTADSWIFMNVSYEDGDLVGVDENSLRMWKHNGTDWTEVSGTNGVNTAENYVYANITEFSVFAPLGNASVKLEINKTSVPDPVLAGGTLNYSISVNNTGNATATNVTVKETYDENVNFVFAVPVPSSGDNTWIFPTLNVSETKRINVTVTVNASTANGTVLHNIVNVSCNERVADYDVEDTTVFSDAVHITSFAPPSPVNDFVCNWRTFNVTVDQTVNVSWYLNGSLLFTNESVRDASCRLHADAAGVHNVSAIASDANSSDMQTWTWNVTVGNCNCGDICVNETGWWRDVGAFIASRTPIQHAIDNAMAGDTICVKDGTYKENVDVTKSHLTIRSENGPSVTTVSASLNPNKHVFKITDQTNVTLDGFEIRDAHGTSIQDVAGIYMKNASECKISDNIVTNIAAMSNAYGIYLYSSSDNSFVTNTVYNLDDLDYIGDTFGIYLSRSSDNSFDTSTVYNLSAYFDANGIMLHSSSDNRFSSTTVYNLSSAENAYGIWLDYSSDNSFSSGSISDINAPAWWDFYSDEDAHRNSAENITISSFPTTISFTYDNGVGIKSVATPPADPVHRQNIGKYVNVTEVSADSWIFMNVSYEEGDLGGVDENTLRLWRHNGTDWTEVPGTNGVNTAENYVYANITEFSVFAPLGNVTGVKLEINKTGVPDPVSPGGTLNYTISVNNTGNATATNVTVTETYDGNVTFVTAVHAPSLGNDTWQFILHTGKNCAFYQ